MKKLILTESDKKQMLLAKEKAIVESFAKTFNSIKRVDENELNGEENITKTYTLEVLPKFWQNTGIKRPAYLGGDEAGQSLLSRDNTIELTLGNEPVAIYRRDTRMYDDKGQKAGRGDDSTFYKMQIYKNNENILNYNLFVEDDKDVRLGGNMTLKPLGYGDFTLDEVGSIDTRNLFKIVAVR